MMKMVWFPGGARSLVRLVLSLGSAQMGLTQGERFVSGCPQPQKPMHGMDFQAGSLPGEA